MVQEVFVDGTWTILYFSIIYFHLKSRKCITSISSTWFCGYYCLGLGQVRFNLKKNIIYIVVQEIHKYDHKIKSFIHEYLESGSTPL